MDPQSISFIPSNNDIWRIQTAFKTVQEAQQEQSDRLQEHSDRLLRLERRQDDDARMKSVWGSASPFPGVLSGTPQHGPVTQPASVDFVNFDDDQSNSMVRSLHLDADDEPRRFGVGSRANSVRFDESAKQGQWAHASRSSVDLLARSSSGLGGHPMFERTVSHKSDGRQSSAGQSAVSGRANSLMFESSNALNSSDSDLPSLPPGLFIIGPVPAIIRCWLNANFKHDSMLYAAVCTGSYKSYLDARLVSNLQLSNQVRQDLSGESKLRLPIYLPEAVPRPASSRSSSPAPQLPTLTVDFTILDRGQDVANSKAIQIFIGSDILRAHNADILFSSNSMTLFDDERIKLSIPLVRPETEETFKCLITSAIHPGTNVRLNKFSETKGESRILSNGDGLIPSRERTATLFTDDRSDKEQADTPNPEPSEDSQSTFNDAVHVDKADQKPSLGPVAPPKLDIKQPLDEPSASAPGARTSASPAAWGHWRRNGGTDQSDWIGAPKSAGNANQRSSRDQGIKVLKVTSRQPSRTTTSTTPLPASPTIAGQSRFFDEGKRRGGLLVTLDTGDSSQQQQKRLVSVDTLKPQLQGKDLQTPISATTPVGTKPRSANPIGEASAFNWLNSGAQR